MDDVHWHVKLTMLPGDPGYQAGQNNIEDEHTFDTLGDAGAMARKIAATYQDHGFLARESWSGGFLLLTRNDDKLELTTRPCEKKH